MENVNKSTFRDVLLTRPSFRYVWLIAKAYSLKEKKEREQQLRQRKATGSERRGWKPAVSLQLKSPQALIILTQARSTFLSLTLQLNGERETIRGQGQTDSDLIEHLTPSGP